MKKIYFLAVAGLFFNQINAQVLDSDNFNSYVAGNFNGQGGWEFDGGSASEIKIVVVDAAHGRSLQFARTGNTDMWFYKDFFLEDKWDSRNAENNIFVANYDFYTGNNTATDGESGIQIYTPNFDYLAGVTFDFATKKFVGSTVPVGEEDAAFFNLNNVVYPNNTWINVKVLYNSTTGKVFWQFNNSPSVNEATTYPGEDIAELDFSTYGAKTSVVDNYEAKAIKPADLAITEAGVEKLFTIGVYPNPTSDFLSVRSSIGVKSVEIFDAAGNIVNAKTEKTENIDVRHLTKGVYVVKVNLENGKTQSKKIVKN